LLPVRHSPQLKPAQEGKRKRAHRMKSARLMRLLALRPNAILQLIVVPQVRRLAPQTRTGIKRKTPQVLRLARFRPIAARREQPAAQPHARQAPRRERAWILPSVRQTQLAATRGLLFSTLGFVALSTSHNASGMLSYVLLASTTTRRRPQPPRLARLRPIVARREQPAAQPNARQATRKRARILPSVRQTQLAATLVALSTSHNASGM